MILKCMRYHLHPQGIKTVALNPRNQIVPVSNLICKKSFRIENSNNIGRY